MRKYIFLIAVILTFNWSCTDNFEELNTNPYEISDESLRQDFNNIGAFYPAMLRNLFGNQVDHNLTVTSYAQHLAQPTPFTGNVNNTTYFVRWNGWWAKIYERVMAPAKQVIDIAEAEELPMFVEWAKLIQLTAISRLTTYYGPVIYSNFGQEGTVLYDSEQELYTAFFSDLDRIINMFMNNLDYTGFSSFDDSYGGDVASWARFANSLRLRLAMRVSKIDPDLAKLQGEKALADPAGLMETNGHNFNIDLGGGKFHPAVICFNWNDTRMSATMESILIGYEDNRIHSFFDPVSDLSLVADHPEYPYKGIRNGAQLVAKGDHIPYSTIDSDFNDPSTVTTRKVMSADEVYFLKAEAALRGWAGAGDAQTNYENGVGTSFELWGASGAAAYLGNSTGLPIDYDDVVYEGEINDFTNRITNTVAWDDAADNETKLEKIITQKWIASYTNEMEAWVDFRRTGYPKLPMVFQNSSSSEHGIVPIGEFIKRMTFPNSERENNPDAYTDGTNKLGGPDEINTRLWWDTGGSNF